MTVVETVPVWVAEVLSAAGTVPDTLGLCGVVLGERVEIDVAAVRARFGDEFAERLLGYHERCREFQRSFAGGEPTGPYVVVRRNVVLARQQDSKAARVDLTSQLDACGQVPLLDVLVDEVTGADPDWGQVLALAETSAGQVTRNGNETTVTVRLEALTVWPDELGGQPTSGEIARDVTLTVNHAGWRDRRNRRLVAVRVDVIEVWPDPDR